MTTRKIIKYEFLVKHYKMYNNRPPYLISRQSDFFYHKKLAIATAIKTVKESNTSKKKLLRITGYTHKDLYGIDADAHSAAGIKKGLYETLNKLLEECDSVHMTLTCADNKQVEITINKTKHNHSATPNKEVTDDHKKSDYV